MPLETYLRAVWDFVQHVRRGMVLNMPRGEETQVFALRLRMNGTWEVLTALPDPSTSLPESDMVIPLVMPLAPIILIAHVETQWARRQSDTRLVAL